MISVLGFGCSQSAIEPTPSRGPSGLVTIYDYQNHRIADRSGVLVEAENTAYKTVTDSNGYWEFPKFPVMSFVMRFSKEGLSTIKTTTDLDQARFPDALFVDMCERPRFIITLDGVVMTSVDSASSKETYGTIYSHTSNYAPDSIVVGQYIIIGRTPTLTIDDTTSFFSSSLGYGLQSKSPDTKAYNITGYFIRTGDLLWKTASGDTVFFRMYPYFLLSKYVDPVTKQYVTDGCGTGSNVLSAVVP